MALKMLYRGPSSRLETLIEKIQQNKEVNQGAYILFKFCCNPFVLFSMK